MLRTITALVVSLLFLNALIGIKGNTATQASSNDPLVSMCFYKVNNYVKKICFKEKCVDYKYSKIVPECIGWRVNALNMENIDQNK